MKLVPTRSTVHLQISPEILNLEPEGDETVICEGKPVGNRYISTNKIFFLEHLFFFLFIFFLWTSFINGFAIVGYTTSGCWSPILNSGLCMASVPCLFSHPGTQLHVLLGGKPCSATVLPGKLDSHLFKGTVKEIVFDSVQKLHYWFTTVPFKHSSEQKCQRFSYFSIWKLISKWLAVKTFL